MTFTEAKERATGLRRLRRHRRWRRSHRTGHGRLLTQYASWRWTLLINVPIAIVTALAAVREVQESRAEGETSYDIPGALTVTGGLLSLVYGFTRAETGGWASTSTVVLLGAAVALLAAFVVIERARTTRCCPCGSSWTATGAARSWRRCWSAWPCSGCSSS